MFCLREERNRRLDAQKAVFKRLEIILLALQSLCLALADNALSDPFRLEAIIELGQVSNDLPARLHDGFLGRDGAVGLDAQLERGEERVRDFVRGEEDGGVLE